MCHHSFFLWIHFHCIMVFPIELSFFSLSHICIQVKKCKQMLIDCVACANTFKWKKPHFTPFNYIVYCNILLNNNLSQKPRKWEHNIFWYFYERQNMCCIFVTIQAKTSHVCIIGISGNTILKCSVTEAQPQPGFGLFAKQ